MPRHLTLTGSVLADRQSEIAANVAGKVITTYVERGQAVKAGTLIALVDAKAAGFSASAALAQAKAAETQHALAVSECERADRLFQQSAITKSDHDRMKTQCSAQLFSAEAARANAGLAAKLAGDAAIRAPFDGVIGERYVNVGEYVMPPSRVASMVSVDPARISISVPESSVAEVRAGQAVEVEVAAYPGRRFAATVRYVAPALRPQTRDLLVEASAPNQDAALKPGMFATVRLVLDEQVMPTVPREALRITGTAKRLFLVKGGVAVEMVVRTGSEKDGRIAILDELTDQDQVVLLPPANLRDGSPIVAGERVQPESPSDRGSTAR